MFRWLVAGRRCYTKQVGNRSPSVVPSPKALTELKANKNLMDVMKMRMPKHGYVGSSLLHAKKPSTATEMVRILFVPFVILKVLV